MKLTLTTEEIKKAITLYLRANAAVEVSDMDFSAKREGVIAEVEAEFIEMNVEPVKPKEVPEALPEETEQHEPEDITEHVPEPPVEDHQPEPEKLVDEEDTPPFTPDPVVSDEDIDKIEAAMTDTEEEEQITFDFESPQEDKVEEMPVQNTMSIANILGI